jgi:hypothetical protein
VAVRLDTPSLGGTDTRDGVASWKQQRSRFAHREVSIVLLMLAAKRM